MYLTPREKEILDFISIFTQGKRYAPTFEEIAEHFGLASLATVHKHITNLEEKGYISRLPNKTRSLIVNPVNDERFVFKGTKLWDNLLNCWWVREEKK